MAAFYNEIEPYCVEWLRKLMALGNAIVPQLAVEVIRSLHGCLRIIAKGYGSLGSCDNRISPNVLLRMLLARTQIRVREDRDGFGLSQSS